MRIDEYRNLAFRAGADGKLDKKNVEKSLAKYDKWINDVTKERDL